MNFSLFGPIPALSKLHQLAIADVNPEGLVSRFEEEEKCHESLLSFVLKTTVR